MTEQDTVKFDTDIPPPMPPKRQLIEKYQIERMEVGHSFFRPGDLKFCDTLKDAVTEWGKKQEPARTFTTKRQREEYKDPVSKKVVDQDGIRIWRVG